jgi:hypothetical protein
MDRKTCVYDYAIDRDGGDCPPRNEKALLKQIKSVRNVEVGILGVLALASHLIVNHPTKTPAPDDEVYKAIFYMVGLGLLMGPVAGQRINNIVRYNRLISGQYVFCATPPPQPQEQRSLSFA